MSEQDPTRNPAFVQALAALRSEIDTVDEQLIALLKDRSQIVEKVGKLKAASVPGRCPIRPGREAKQIRHVVNALKGSGFSPAAGAAIWRMMIMSALKQEGDLKISVYAPEGREYMGLAREYFGGFSTFIRHPSPKRVLGDLIDGKAQVGVLPPFADQTHGRWWTDIPGKDEASKPKIFALLPGVHAARPTPDTLSAIAVGIIEPEDTGDDLSFLMIEADEMVSHSKLQAAFAIAKLEARWIEVLTQVPGKRHHLVEVKSFLTAEHPKYKAFLAGLNNAPVVTAFLGAAAAPVVLDTTKPATPAPHVQPAHA